jgi:glycosyltransferase involved in cell wall biosynthesis
MHIERCLRSVLPHVQRVAVIDSNSTDNTRELAASMGADVYRNDWINHATQFNWALDNADIDATWILRLDADEVLTDELADKLETVCVSPSEGVSGFTVNRQIHFLGRWMRHGSIYPLRMLRLFRFGKGRCEQRWMDEHIVVDGDVEHLDADIIDDNLNSLTWWIDKHNGYATREVIDIVSAGESEKADAALQMSSQAKFKRWLKESVYNRLPLGVRPGMYFFYRYFIRLGFLDGRQGLIFHVLQGFWYRFLVDAKLLEVRKFCQKENVSEQQAINSLYGVRI